MGIDLDKLAKFLVKVKKKGFAGGAKYEKRFDEKFFEFECDNYLYEDAYKEVRENEKGPNMFFGKETVYLKNYPVWRMTYTGNLLKVEDEEAFNKFLRSALLQVNLEHPFRGPFDFKDGEYRYHMFHTGDILDFKGEENVFLNDEPIFLLGFSGGVHENAKIYFGGYDKGYSDALREELIKSKKI